MARGRRTALLVVGFLLLALLAWWALGGMGAGTGTYAPDPVTRSEEDPLPPPLIGAHQATEPLSAGVPPEEPKEAESPPPNTRASAADPDIEEGLKHEDLPLTLRSTILDRATGKPVAGVDVALAIFKGDRFEGTWMTKTDDKGEFRFAPRQLLLDSRPTLDPKHRLEFRARAPGYRVLRATLDEAAKTLYLDPQLTAPKPGTLQGFARDSKGRPAKGVVRVWTIDRDFGLASVQLVKPDEDGRFEMQGVPAGPIQMLGEGWKTVEIPEGGTVWQDITAPDEPDTAMQVPTREVEVTGLPTDVPEGTVVRALTTDGKYFRTWVLDGVAHFPHVFVGKQRMEMVRPDGTKVEWMATVKKGEGKQTVEFPGEK